LESDNKRIKDLQNIVLYNEKEKEMEERLEKAEQMTNLLSKALIWSYVVLAGVIAALFAI
jgi:predicted nucleic acid-binding protein